MSYPPSIEIAPLTRLPQATVRVPGSKSITNRALVLAALSGQGCHLRGALHSEDTEVMVDSLQRLGFEVKANWPAATVTIGPNRTGRVIPAKEADLFVANSGTSMRFLTAMVSAGSGRYRLDGVPRMRERPIDDLLAALQQLGVAATSENGNGCPPVRIESDGIPAGPVSVRGDMSSQFLSALLMSTLRAKGHVTIRWCGPYVSLPYVWMTVQQMEQFGATLSPMEHRFDHPPEKLNFLIPAPQCFGIPSYAIQADATAASYFWGAAAITRGTIGVAGLTGGKRLQGDVRFVGVLESMGCKRKSEDGNVIVKGRLLHGIDVDMNDISDTVMTLGAVACFAEGPTRIRNVAHIRHKETDRIAALATELRRVGAGVEEHDDGLTIVPGPLHGARIQTYNDHRMAMSMALIGLKVPGIVIDNPACVAKTYPGFFADLEKLR